MDGHGNGGDDAEHHRRRRRAFDTARKRGSRRWLKYGLRLPSAFKRRKVDEYNRELAARRIESSGSSATRSSSAGTSSSRTVTPVKRTAEELGPLVVKLEDDVGQLRGGVIGPEDYLPPGQEDHLMCAIMERSVREVAEDTPRNRRKLEIEQIFLE
ncbi:Nitrate reductase (NADH) [Hordeum vulgare]|nr:Nitrate reductase (NADH) [Hordeum vulgare]